MYYARSSSRNGTYNFMSGSYVFSVKYFIVRDVLTMVVVLFYKLNYIAIQLCIIAKFSSSGFQALLFHDTAKEFGKKTQPTIYNPIKNINVK